MTGFLLDTNMLIALLWPSHAHHQLAVDWFLQNRRKGWATCPLTQAGFIRIVSNPAFSRDAVRPLEAVELLEANTSTKEHSFWQCDQTMSGAVSITGVRLVGHQQITDAYLLGLAMIRGGKLATLDRRIEKMMPADSGGVKYLELVE
jgi:toxin-antitoxin system PIN domain toxin